LEQSTLQVMATPPQPSVLELASVGTFATRWLIPRLSLFSQMRPDVVVNVSTRNDPFVLGGSGFDAAITFDHPAWAGVELRHLFRSSLIPVCRPDLVPPEFSLGTAFPAGVRLLNKTTTPASWRDYSREVDVDLRAAAAGSRFDQFSMLIEAALAGVGVALVPSLYVADEVESGRLVRIGPPGWQVGKDFILVANSQSPRIRLLNEFSDWLVREAADAVPTSPQETS